MRLLPKLLGVAAFACVCAAVLAACGGGASSSASSASAGASGGEAGGASGGSTGGASTSVASAEASFPAKFDLRDMGVVTPVKFQNPWGACWSFGGIAAAETSILTTLGMTADQYREKTGSDFNLSENHLVWFSRLPITAETNSEQAGEGLHVIGWLDGGDQFEMYNGGDSTLVTSMFANGVGPVDEDLFPYRGKEGITDWDYFSTYDTDPADVQAAKMKEVCTTQEQKLGMTLDEAVQKMRAGTDPHDLFGKLYHAGCLDESWPGADKTDEQLVEDLKNAFYKFKLNDLRTANCYTAHDDWVLPIYAEGGDGSKLPNRDIFCGYTLKHGNILPYPVIKDEEDRAVGTDPDSIVAIKSELSAGRGVSIRFYADKAVPGQDVSENGYMNTKTWAQYTYEDRPVTHGVCIVGWDDSIPKGMFNDDPAKQPPANGAWIVKNSWGSETEYSMSEGGQRLGCNDWGIENDAGEHTGYFYLSYYDKSIDSPETMEFGTDFADFADGFRVYAHDYMPLTVDWTDSQPNMTKTANVFKNEEGADQELRSVGTRTAEPGDEVTFNVYLLSEDAKNPEDGELVATKSATYDYKGYHREILDTPVTIEDGQRFSVVVMEKGKDANGADQYSYATVCSNSKKFAEENDYPAYGVPILHAGESFVYEDGKWTDWVEGLLKFMEAHEASDDYVFENFSIKAYMVAKSK